MLKSNYIAPLSGLKFVKSFVLSTDNSTVLYTVPTNHMVILKSLHTYSSNTSQPSVTLIDGIALVPNISFQLQVVDIKINSGQVVTVGQKTNAIFELYEVW